MRIGIDGKHISNLQKGGFKTYSINLIENLAKIDNGNEYFIYLDREINFNKLPQQKNFHYIIIKATNPFMTALREQFLLARRAKEEKLDLFHFLANTGAISFPIKYIVTLHDIIEFLPEEKLGFKYRIKGVKQGLLYKYDRFVIPKVAKKAKHIITISKNSKKEIMDLFKIDKEKISVIYEGFRGNFVILSNVNAKKKFGLEDKYILAFGSVDLRKNLITLLKAYSKLKNFSVQLVIASSHSIASRYLRVESAKCGITARVKILENISDEYLKSLFSEASVFVFPSYYEGFGLPVLEAMALGTPVVCSHTSSLPEVGDKAVKYINPSNPQEIKDAIYEILTNNALAQEMCIKGKLQAQKFSWERCAEETLAVYKKALQEN